MFSGIVETVGIINTLKISGDCHHITLTPHESFTDLNIGDSISVNGACLTVTGFSPQTLDVTIVPETLRLTNLGKLIPGTLVNLERSLKMSARIGGHYVQGHIDGIGNILDLHQDGHDALLIKISLPETLTKYVVNKGYIAMDGMSITVIEATNEWFTVTLIPHTQAVTIANQYAIGTAINIEVDILSKYVEKLMRKS